VKIDDCALRKASMMCHKAVVVPLYSLWTSNWIFGKYWWFRNHDDENATMAATETILS